MRIKLVMICGALLLPLLAFAVGAGQDTIIAWGFMETDQQLMTVPGGPTPIPDGTPVEIYWDQNSNGPDAADTLLPQCDLPPNCETGPSGTFNYNTFPMNGGYMGFGEGYFYTESYLAAVGMIPSPSNVYLRVASPFTLWTSNVVTLASYPAEFEMTSWIPADIPLPVSLGSFVAEPLDNAVKLVWSTHSESNAVRFELLRDERLLHIEQATNTPTDHTYTFTDQTALNGITYRYGLRLVNRDGSSEQLAAQFATPAPEHATVTEYALHQNYPNPFNATTRVGYDLVEDNTVVLSVHNTAGQAVAELLRGRQSAGVHTVDFHAEGLPSGVYFFTLTIGSDFTATKKMLLLK